MLALRSGGFSPGDTAVATLVVGGVLVVDVLVRGAAGRSVTASAGVAILALAAFAAWSLLSSSWSHSPSRAILEYNRTLLYLGVLVLFARLGRSRETAGHLAVGLHVTFVAVSVAALAAYLLPGSVSWADGLTRSRLNWPTSYWNTTGLIGALAVLSSVHGACLARRPVPVRALAAASVPAGVAVVYFSVSRGALLVSVVGLVVLLVLGRSRGTLTGLPVVVVAAVATYAVCARATGLTADSIDADGVASGHRTAVLLLLVALASACLRAVMVLGDRRLARVRSPEFSVAARRAAAAVALAAVVVAFVSADGVGRVRQGWQRFASDAAVPAQIAPVKRFSAVGSNGRLAHYRVALRYGFRPHPLRGTGVGTFAVVWNAHRPNDERVVDAHSLYIEVLGELGLVGLALLLLLIGTMLVALVRRARQEGDVWPLFAASLVAWCAGAGLDWYWEMPAVTAWLFAVGGLALSRPSASPEADGTVPSRGWPSPLRSLAVAVAVVLLATTPVLVHRSQAALTDAIRAFRVGDCATTTRRSLDALAALNARPEPFELLSYCDVRAGRTVLAAAAAKAAVRRDPDDWEFRYDLALVRAAGGADPRPAARQALTRNPRDPRARAAYEAFRHAPPRRWRSLALAAPTLVPARP